MRSKIAAALAVPLVLGLLALAWGNRVTAATPATSQNGWTVVEKGGTESYAVAGSKVKLRLRKGDAAVVLLDVAHWFDQNIEDIDQGADDWGWSVRKIAGSSSYSNHASGTAIDLNASKHPQGVATAKNLSKKQIDAVHAQLKARWQGVVRWGGDYTSRPDAMHFEINKGAAAVKAVAASIGRPQPAPSTTKAPTTKSPTTARPGTPTTAAPAPTTAAPVPTTATTVESPEPATGEQEGAEEPGPVEPQAPVEAPVPPMAPVAVAVRPSFTG
jgi:hypothetical protein